MAEIDTLYAWMAFNDEGEEGIVGVRSDDGWLPMVTGSKRAILAWRDEIILIGKATNKDVRLIEFSRKSVLEVAYVGTNTKEG